MNNYVSDLLEEEYYNYRSPRITRRMSESGNDIFGNLYNDRLESIDYLKNEIEDLTIKYKKEPDEDKKDILRRKIERLQARLDKISVFGYDFIEYRNRYPFLEAHHEELKERFLIKYYNYRVGYNTLEFFSYKLRGIFEDVAPEYENRLRIQAMYEKQILEDGKLKDQEFTDLSKSTNKGNNDAWSDSKDSGKSNNWTSGESSGKTDGWSTSDNNSKSDNWNEANDKGKGDNWADTNSVTASSFFNEQNPEVKRKSDENDGKVNTHSANTFDNSTSSHSSNTSESGNKTHSTQDSANKQESHTSQDTQHQQESHTSNKSDNTGTNEHTSLQIKVKNIISGYQVDQNILRDYLNEYGRLFIQVWTDEIGGY